MQKAGLTLGLILLLLLPMRAHGGETLKGDLDCSENSLYCPTTTANKALASKLHDFPVPKTTGPPKPKPVIVANVPSTVTYDVVTRGTITANLSEFKSLASATLNDTRGWHKLGVNFVQTTNPGNFTLVLAAANQMTSFWSGCSSLYSCQTGRYVIINQDRWLGATTSWNNAGGSLRDYRHMVVNHETGHWLGHSHSSCPGAGKPAAVMQQQSIDLQGCKFNPWPLASELWSSRLGL